MSSELEKNQKYCDVIGSKVKLITKPVAMKLIKSEDEIPEGFNLIDEKVRHCEMVRKASLGEKYYSLGRFKDLETAKSLTSKLSIVEDKHWGMLYAPLDEADFKADVIQIITEPVGGMKLAQSIVYASGEKINPNFAGIQSLCGDAFANPYIEKGVNFTLGCDGSRKAADVKDNEMAIGISADKIDEVISGLESI